MQDNKNDGSLHPLSDTEQIRKDIELSKVKLKQSQPMPSAEVEQSITIKGKNLYDALIDAIDKGKDKWKGGITKEENKSINDELIKITGIQKG